MTLRFTTFARPITALARTFLTIPRQADTATNRILFDFQTPTHLPAWEVVNDDVRSL